MKRGNKMLSVMKEWSKRRKNNVFYVSCRGPTLEILASCISDITLLYYYFLMRCQCSTVDCNVDCTVNYTVDCIDRIHSFLHMS